MHKQGRGHDLKRCAHTIENSLPKTLPESVPMNHPGTTTRPSSSKASVETPPIYRKEVVLSRRRFISIAIIVGVATHFIFAMINLHRGIWGESILDVVMGILLLGGFLFNGRQKFESRTTRIILLSIVSISIAAGFLFEQNTSQSVLIGFYVILPSAIFVLGAKHGVIFSIPVFTIVCIISVAPQIIGRPPLPPLFPQRFIGSLIIVAVLAWVLERVRAQSWRLIFRATEVLQEATRTLNTMEGLIPICSYCKKIRQDERYWQNLETYLRNNTSAHISSGYCPKCAEIQAPQQHNEDDTCTVAVSEMSLDSDISAKIKRWTSIGFLSAGVLVLWGLAALEIIRRRPENAVFYLTVSLPYMGCIALHKKNRWRLIADNVFIGSIVILVFQQVTSVQQNTFALFWLFVVPITANFLAGLRTGKIWSGIALILLIILFNSSIKDPTGSLNPEFKFKFTAFFAILSVLAYMMERIQEQYAEAVLDRLASLKQTYRSIRTLKGLVPVCASCKSIRDDAGFWTSMEDYLAENTDLKLSHGICPRCLKVHFPDVYKEMREKELIVKAEDVRTSDSSAKPYLASLSPSSVCENDE